MHSFELLQETLHELRHQYTLYLQGFDDVKKKAELFLVICSLFISIPFFSSAWLSAIATNRFIKYAYLSSLLLFVLSIILVIQTMRIVAIRLPKTTVLLKEEYAETERLEAFVKQNMKDLERTVQERGRAITLNKWIDRFISAGVIIFMMSIGAILVTI